MDCYTSKEDNIENSESLKGQYEFDDLSNKIIGVAIKVHRELGPGFLENIYEEALKVELSVQGFLYDAQKEIKIKYLGVDVGTHRLDLIIEKEIIVELKTVKELIDIHFAQLRSYLKATDLKVGLLLNFAKPTLEIKRIVN
ncbi:MAG: GxxExxY protein [Deltaproteobacteria bacterium]|nr:GxxExxY protein [Deltaproteobacteria bacterium]